MTPPGRLLTQGGPRIDPLGLLGARSTPCEPDVAVVDDACSLSAVIVFVVVVVVMVGGADKSSTRDCGLTGQSVGRPRSDAQGDSGDNVGGALGGVKSSRGRRL